MRKYFYGTLFFIILFMAMSQISAAQTDTPPPPPEGTEPENTTEPDHESLIARIRRKMQEATEEKKYEPKRGIVPRIGTIGTSSGLAGGIAFRSHYLEASAALSYKRYQEYSVQAGINAPRPGVLMRSYKQADLVANLPSRDVPTPYALYGDFRYRSFPREVFFLTEEFGESPDGDPQRTDYSFKETSFTAVGGYRFGRPLYIDLRLGLVKTDSGKGSDSRFPDIHKFADPSILPELDQNLEFIRSSAGVVLDYRDFRGNPHTGGVVGVLFAHWNERNSDQFDFSRFTFDARYYQAVGSPSRVVALRFLTSLSSEKDGGKIPFYLQETLGGSHTLRGFPEFRFRDNHLLAGSVEFRWEFKPWLEIAPFYDFGKTFAHRSDFDFSNLEKSYGIGVRFKAPRSVIFRMDFGHSDEGTDFHFSFGSSY
jgi:hypothetical protein